MATATLRAFCDRRSGEVDLECAPPGMLLVIAVGDPYRVGIGANPASTAMGGFAIGPQSQHGSSELTGSAEGVQVDLSWSAAAGIFGPTLSELADRAVMIMDLPNGPRLVDQLSCTPTADRLRLVAAWLRERSDRHLDASPVAMRAVQRIEDGVCTVGGLADELGCSRGHVHRAVRSLTGQSPTTLMRVVRLHRLIALRGRKTLADLAAAGGTPIMRICVTRRGSSRDGHRRSSSPADGFR